MIAASASYSGGRAAGPPSGAVQPSAEAMQTLLQVMYACLNSAVAQRPTAATVAHILDHQIY